MKCNRDKQTASLYLSDILNKAERGEFERHLRTCEECRAEVERYRRMMGLLRDLPRAKAPESLHSAVTQRMKSAEEKTAPAGLGKILGLPAFRAVAAALVLAVGAGLAFYAFYPIRDMGLQVTEEKIYDKTETDRPPAEEARVAGDARTSTDMPGSIKPAAFLSNIKNVDDALKNMNYDALNDLVARNHGTIMTFAEAQAAPEFNDILASSPGDRNVYLQLAQKRVIVNALKKTEDFEKAESITKTLDTGNKNLRTEAPRDEAAEMESDAEKDESIKGVMKMESGAETEEAIRAYERGLREKGSAHMLPPGIYRFRAKGDTTKDVTLVFQQELTVAPQRIAGRKAGLDEETKSDLKLVFDNLPTLENYSVETFTRNGFTVRLSEEEFLRLLKYIKDVGGIRAELGPIQAALKTEEPERTMKAMDEKAVDPYAVNLRIRVLEK